jgi:hypothetical protein
MKTLLVSLAAVTLVPLSSLVLHSFGIGFAESVAIGATIALIAAAINECAPRSRPRLADRMFKEPARDDITLMPQPERMPTGVQRAKPRPQTTSAGQR